MLIKHLNKFGGPHIYKIVNNNSIEILKHVKIKVAYTKFYHKRLPYKSDK